MKYFPRVFGLLFVLILFCSNIFAQPKIEKAISLIELGNYAQAKDILEDILDENDENAQANYYLGRAFIGLRDYSEASDYLEEAIEIDKKNAEYHFWLAQAYAGDAQESSFFTAAFIAPKIKDEFAETIKIDPQHVGGHVGLANFHLNAPGIVGGDLEEALKVGRKLVKLDEKQGRFILIHYYVKKEMVDSVQSQLAILEDKFSGDKSFASFYNRYGYLLLNKGDYEEAIKYFKKQVDMRPDDANSYDSLGDGFRAKGNFREAAEQYKKALAIDPDFEVSQKNLEEVNKELKLSN